MAEPNYTSGNLICSFCGKNQNQVRKLIAGPTVFICDECVDLCCEIFAEDVGPWYRRYAAKAKFSLPLVYVVGGMVLGWLLFRGAGPSPLRR